MFEDKIAEMNTDTQAIYTPRYEKRVYTVEEIQDILGVSNVY